MDWKSVADSVIKLGAPTLGTFLRYGGPVIGTIAGGALGGPAGAAIGAKAGSIIAEVLGAKPTPEGIAEAIAQDPEAASQKLTRAEELHAARLENEYLTRKAELETLAKITDSQVQNAEAVNVTIREELAEGTSWYHWRHLIGHTTHAWIAMPLPIVAYHMLFNTGRLNEIINAMTELVPWVGIAAALNGVVATDTTKLRSTAITGERPPSLLEMMTGGKKTPAVKK